MAFVSLEYAKRQCRIPADDSTFDAEIDAIRVEASAIVEDYLTDYLATLGSPAWDEDTDPATEPPFAIVQAAVGSVVANLWRHRGDDDAPGPMTSRVEQMLRGLHVPPLG